MKFGRNYQLQIDMLDDQGLLIVKPPLTVQFTMNRNIMASLNIITVDVFNLNTANRQRVFQDRYDIGNNRTLRFDAGYDTLSKVFSGNIYSATTHREGTNFITSLECRTGQYDTINTQINTTLAAGKKVSDVLRYLCQQLGGLSIAGIGEFDEVLPREVVLNGNVYELIKQYSHGTVFIDNDKIAILKPDEVLAGETFVINSETGLLDTPRRAEAFINVSTLFEPRINIGSKIKLESSVMPIYNGEYKVLGIQHTGTISEAIGGDCRSVFNLYKPSTIFKEVSNGD